MRRPIALAVIVLHGLALWLLMAGSHPPPDEERPPQFVSLWITPPAPETPRAEAPLPPRTMTPQPRPIAAEPPAAPITLPTSPTPPTPESTALPAGPAPLVDWAREATLGAQRSADAAAAKRDTFGDPPKTVGKPCKPKERSMEWNGAANPGIHWAGPIPILVTKRCVITIGFFSCLMGSLPPPNIHLLDDLKDPNRSRSSVPDPNICD